MPKLKLQHASKQLSKNILLPLTLVAAGTGYACAENAAPGESWQFEVMPYLWATRMSGDVKAGRLPDTKVDMKFSDIVDVLDFGFMTAFEARKGRWGFLLDGMYMKVSDSVKASGNGVSVRASARIEQGMLAGAVAYRLIENQTPVDLIGGLRYNSIDVDAKVNGVIEGTPGIVLKKSGSKDWTDPYVGVRVLYPINEKWSSVLYADVGGFGAGSDLTWQGMAGLSYAHSKSMATSFGYRYMKVDYDKGSFRYDMANDGLYAGIAFRF